MARLLETFESHRAKLAHNERILLVVVALILVGWLVLSLLR